jgi:predicted transcriptional regulator
LVFIEKVNQGLEDVKNGRTVDHDELKREMEQWFK